MSQARGNGDPSSGHICDKLSNDASDRVSRCGIFYNTGLRR